LNTSKKPSGNFYVDYDCLIRNVEKWVDRINPKIIGCEDSQVRARIVQRILELTGDEFSDQLVSQNRNYPESPGLSNKVIFVGGLKVNQETGKITVTYKQWLLNSILFVVSWFQILIFLVPGLFRRSPKESTAATLLMEAGGDEENNSRFVQYCQQGPIEPLYSAKQIIIKSKNKPQNSADHNIVYTPQPLTYLISNNLVRSTKLLAFYKHLSAPVCYLRAIINSPINILLGRDLSTLPIVKLLNEGKFINSLIATTSSFAVQFLWMKGLKNQKFKLHMIWYSQNFIPKMYQGDKKRPDLPAARHMRVDVHWVWTKGFSEYLGGLGQESEIRVVGPILWYLPEAIEGLNDNNINIVMFDVTPISGNDAKYGAIKNYYSVATIKKFVIDILNISAEITEASGKEEIIFLKHKRVPEISRHASEYLDFLHDIEKNNSNFKLISPQINLYGLLNICQLSIAVPYTSTTYVAESLEKTAIYYDPFAELVPKFESSRYVHFASGANELRHLMGKCLKVNIEPNNPSLD